MVRLASVEDERLDHEIGPLSFLEVSETFGATADDPTDRGDKLILSVRFIDLLLVSVRGIPLAPPVFPFDGDFPTGPLVDIERILVQEFRRGVRAIRVLCGRLARLLCFLQVEELKDQTLTSAVIELVGAYLGGQ